MNPEIDNAKSNTFTAWLSEHPTLKLVASLVAIIGGLFGIITFLTGMPSLPELLSLLNQKYYDRFDLPVYGGDFDTNLWRRSGVTGISFEQRDGSLVLQPVDVKEGGNIALFPRKLQAIPFQEFRAMEAKLKLGSNASGPGFVKIQV